jgi:preprotein translocase subunit YajC
LNLLALADSLVIAQTSAPGTPAAPASQPAPAPVDFIRSVGPFLLIIIVFYLFMFRNKNTAEKKRQAMLAELKKGVEVQTIGGEIGKVLDVRPDRVLLKVDESSNAKIWYVRSAIHRVLTDDAAETK